MHRADAKDETGCFDWTEWLLPGLVSLLAHIALAVGVVVPYLGQAGASGIIKAQLLDIADSNSLKKASAPTDERRAAREVSNQELVERLNFPMGLPRNLRCTVAVTVAEDGRVLQAVVTQSTGNPNFDQSIVEAVYRSSPFPKPPAEQLQGGMYRFELKLGEQ